MKSDARVLTKDTFKDRPLETIRLSVLIPVYNSEATLEDLVSALVSTLQARFGSLEIVLVNDGSRDDSHVCALRAAERYRGIIKYVRLARNFGEHNAVMCGLNYISGDCVVIIDDDFQNPPSEIPVLVEKLREGYDVVYSYYARKQHSLFRNLGSRLSDWFATKFLRKPRLLYLSSFKAITAEMARTIAQYHGPYPYIDGIILRSTMNIGKQLCKHESRRAGRSNYTIGKLVQVWANMFTGSSIIPLRVASFVGLAMSFLSIFLGAFFIVSRLVGGIFSKQPIPAGWASLIISIVFFGGLQLCVLGLIGEYLGRLCLTVNQMPQFVVSETYGIEKE